MAKNIEILLKEVLKQEGLRFTNQRLAVWDEIKDSNDHCDADQIYENIKSKNIKVAGDPSSAVFLAVAAIITKKSSISIENVLLDKFRLTVFETLKKMGANIRIIKENGSQCKIIVKSSKLKNILVKSNKSSSLIDEYPILSIAAACGSGDMVMEGLSELRFKESDRYRAIINGLNKAGVTAVGYKDSKK